MRKVLFIVTVMTISLLTSCASNNSSNQTPQNNKNVYDKDNRTRFEGDNTAIIDPTDNINSKVDLKQASKLNAQLAIAYVNEGLLDRAKEKLMKSQKLAKDNGYNLAIVDYAAGYYYQAMGSKHSAEDKYKKAVDNYPNDYEALNFYAQFVCTVKRDYSQAEKMYEESMLLPSNNNVAQTLYLYAQCYNLQNKKQDVIAMLLRSLKFDRNFLPSRLTLAETYYDVGEYENADKIINAQKNNKAFYLNYRVLLLRLELAKKLSRKSEEAMLMLMLSSKDFDTRDEISDFYLPAIEEKKEKA